MDVESGLQPVVSAAFPDSRVLTITPNDLEAQLPVIKLLATGGTGDQFRFEGMGVEVDTYASSKSAASQLCWAVYHWFMEQMPDVIGRVGVLRVDSVNLPVQTSYENPDIFRYTCNVRVNTHDRGLS